MDLQRDGMRQRRQMLVDHYTLGPDRVEWHIITTTGRHQHGPVTYEYGPESRMWFGLSIADESILRVARQVTRVPFEVEERELGDLERRGKILQKAAGPFDGLVLEMRSELSDRFSPGVPPLSRTVHRWAGGRTQETGLATSKNAVKAQRRHFPEVGPESPSALTG